MEFQSEFLNLRCMDCMEMMAQYPDNYFDLAICDPEYGIGAGKKKSYHKNALTKYKSKDWDSQIPSQAYFNELLRCSKQQIIWGYNYFAHLLPPCPKPIVWDKMQPEGLDQAMFELAYNSQSNLQAKIFRKSIQSSCNKVANNKYKAQKYKKIHPTQKPIELYKWLLANYAKAGDKILDTYLGSGSIAIACHDYKFELTACEIDSDYFSDMLVRVQNHLAQLVLF
jgi:site-specific DNA-methyltransferase (adenine-specific)